MYDLCSLLPYRNRENKQFYLPKLKMAMKVGKEYALRKADRESAWGRAADDLGISRSEASERMKGLSGRIRDALDSAISALPARAAHSPYVSKLSDGIEKRAVTGIAVSRALARTSRSAQSDSRDHALEQQLVQFDPVRKTACGYRGPRSKKPCILSRGHRGQHRYSS